LALETSDKVELDYLLPVAGVSELQAKDLGVILCLLQAISGALVFGLGFDDGEGEVARVAEEIVGAFAFTPLGVVAAHDDAAFGEPTLLSDGMRLVVPASRLEQRDDKLAACVRLVHW